MGLMQEQVLQGLKRKEEQNDGGKEREKSQEIKHDKGELNQKSMALLTSFVWVSWKMRAHECTDKQFRVKTWKVTQETSSVIY